YSRRIPEQRQRLFDGQVEDVGDIVVAVSDGEDVGLEAPSPASRAAHLHVGQEVHVYGEQTGSFAAFAMPARNIEREVAGSEVEAACLSGFSEKLADRREGVGVCGGVGAGCAPDSTLVD